MKISKQTGAVLMGEKANERKLHGRKTENKNSRKSIIKMNHLPLNEKELNEAKFCFFYNEILEL